MNTLTAVILTYNEDIHLERCLSSVIDIVDEVIIVDSYSSDRTLDIATDFKVKVYQNEFVNQANQINWILEQNVIKTDFVLRLDADEVIDLDLSLWISNNIKSLDNTVTGIYLNRYITFLDKMMLYGGMSTYWTLRIWRSGYGRCEQRWMDEHILLLSGRAIKASGKLIDYNLNTLGWWSHKHVDYSTREAIEILLKESIDNKKQIKADFFGSNSERIRYLKSVYNKLPLFTRPFLYFIYRYICKAGFLDGKEGFLWCLLQGFWYRMLVDAKVFEIKKIAKKENKTISLIVKEKYGYEI